MRPTENWQTLAETLGFQTEEDMLKHLYILQEFSLEQMHHILGYCVWSIRRRLIELGVPLRGRGGAKNRLGKGRLRAVSDEELLTASTAALAAKYQVHVSTVYSEIRLREKEKTDAIRGTYADKLLSNLGG